MNPFQTFSKLVHARYTELAKGELFTTLDGNDLYATYLAAFPEGTNPVYIVKTEHDCSCCRNFVKNLGNVVAVIDGKVESVWNITGAPFPYDTVAEVMHKAVTNKPITDLFRTSEAKFGAETSRQMLASGQVKTWNHFHGGVARKHQHSTPDAVKGNYRTTVQVFQRGLEELKPEALATVQELIGSNALYRGTEFKATVDRFIEAQRNYLKSDPQEQSTFAWVNAESPAARFRNSAIGSLVVDLSEGKDLEYAVKAFESKVAPTYYKRPTAIITPSMVKAAMETITELGLEAALERRFAKIGDITINNVLWADGSAKNLMKGSIGDLLMASAKQAPIDPGKGQDITIADFMADVLPKATSIDMLVGNRHTGNFVSLTAPVHAGAAPLFKWGNGFAWSYAGNIADSIKERVKNAGGSVTGDLCCRLAWEYTDDLDFHMKEPDGGHIYFGKRRLVSRCGGMLDLDANGADGQRADPAENIVYADKRRMKPGVYHLSVNNYSHRSDGKGFVVEVELGGVIHNFVHEKVLRTNESVSVADITVAQDGKIEVTPLIASTPAGKMLWGVKTENLVKVQSIMHSPNHWDGECVGNKHYIFTLEGCLNPEPARGVYNEFLSNNLDKHRKVFETIGEKTKCRWTDEQLSGLGFSSTKADNVTVIVKSANTQRTYNVQF